MYVYMERVKNSSDVSFALRQVDKPVSNYGAFNELEKSKECGVYINPFRVVDLSVIPSHILQELESYPILTQIAILSNPEIRKKYFPFFQLIHFWMTEFPISTSKTTIVLIRIIAIILFKVCDSLWS